ncbi:sugar transferase [Selenomonas ruminantium]|uniref:sugar transferase n=1 Tax=Selenomonas ruminantium TaxID=971 RepID=UPI000416FAD8|nr:sugar transferase [Selenomonas ruminantium]
MHTEINPMEGKKVVFVENIMEPENADGVRGHLEAVADIHHVPTVYEAYIKRSLDIILSLVGLLVLSPIFLALSIWIYLDDPGPIFFSQRRIGNNKRYFQLHKFRSMKMCTPHDRPTHMLDNPEQYITKAGKFIRAHSLDELPQIWDIFIGNMSIIGPRPGLWNQDLLTAERDKYGANDIKPGLTGWAQINGRDELEIPAKAKLDGDYTSTLKNGGMKAFFFDIRCFLGTIFSVLRSEGVVEGGTGEMKKHEETVK